MIDANTTAVLVDAPDDEDETALYVGAWLAGYSSTKTRDAYQYDIGRWIRWCYSHGLHPFYGVKRAQVQLYARGLEDRGLAPATRERALSTVTSFMRWLCEEGVVDSNPAQYVRRPPRGDQRGAEALTRTEAADWLAAASSEGGYPYALACLLLFNGLRVGEVERCTVDDLGTSQWHPTLRVHGKGDRIRVAALAPITRQAVDAALAGRAGGALVLNEAGRPINRQNVTTIVKRLGRKAGIDKKLSPHGMRATMITQALNAGVPLRDVQQAAGHATVTMTLRYDRARESLNRHATYSVAQWVSSAA